ncbi:YqxA family protein [Niallia sp. 01092]|uniref:YqxA family protein n=1 Tax=unclassified Niallia TaxID=2837522 RepID=UPI003FD3DC95
MFTFRAIGIAIIMFLCVLFGMQQAYSGIRDMKGYEDKNFSSALSIEKKDDQLEASVLGQDVTSHDLQKKKEKLEELHAFNLFSNIGKGVADSMSSLAQKGVDLVGSVMDDSDKQKEN